MTTYHRWSEEEKEHLKKIAPNTPIEQIQRLMTKKFNYEYTYRQITAVMRRFNVKNGLTTHLFEKGSTPWNKGTKGKTIPWNKGKKMGPSYNRSEVGTEYVDKRGYLHVKIENPDKWKLKHHIIYENHYGPIEKGYNVIFADKDKRNFSIDNLIKVKISELMIMNKNGLIYEDTELTKLGVNVAKLISKTNDKVKNGVK